MHSVKINVQIVILFIGTQELGWHMQSRFVRWYLNSLAIQVNLFRNNDMVDIMVNLVD